MKSLLFLWLIVFAVLTGCATSSPRSRGSLSGAMDKARDDNEGSREVPDKQDPRWERDREDRRNDDDGTYNRQDGDTSGTGVDPYDGPMMLMIRYGGALGGSPYYSGQKGFELALGMTGDSSVDLIIYGGIHVLETNRDHPVYESIGESALLLNAGIEGRFYPFDKMQFFSPYAGGRAGGIYMSWSFENPLAAGADTIVSDALGGLSLGVCAGVDFIHTDTLRLGIQLNPEAYLFGGETSEGFENDYFGAQGLMRVSIDGGIVF